MKNIDICIAGLGNVGSSLIKLLERNKEHIKNKSDLIINVIGISAQNKSKKRDFDMLLDTLDYETLTSHLNFNYFFEPLDINLNLSYGKYLAKDIGYTFDLSRISKIGIRSGFFFTRTDVPAKIFGEGSFDKGFYINFPLEAFFTTYRKGVTNFGLSPMTRDGGAALNVGHSLYGVTDEGWLIHLQRDSDDLYD